MEIPTIDVWGTFAGAMVVVEGAFLITILLIKSGTRLFDYVIPDSKYDALGPIVTFMWAVVVTALGAYYTNPTDWIVMLPNSLAMAIAVTLSLSGGYGLAKKSGLTAIVDSLVSKITHE